MVRELIKNLVKDLKIEFRNRFALNVSLSFAGIITIAISLSLGGVPLSPKVQSVLYWIIIFFSAMNGLSHVFIREEEQGTALFLRLNSSPEAVFFSKLVFNIIVFLMLQIIITPLFIFFIQVEVLSYAFFIMVVLLGGVAISSSVTILAAIVAKAGGKGALFTVISFPVALPVLWISISAASGSFEREGFFDNNNLVFLLAFSIAVIAVSSILFEYIWVEE